jgi:glutamyl-tRNA synthetase
MTVRTRYAPSPTGYLHVGGLRTALYNYLFARQQNGQCILRIEDTDQTRKVEGAIENLIEIFDWLSLHFAEGPHLGGPVAPYVQSQRLLSYHEHIQLLAAAGHVYPCFCSSERLEEMRKAQAARSAVPMYDQRCRTIPISESERRIAGGEPHVWRMAVPDDQTVIIHDLVRGDVRFESSTIDDQVLVKSDGFPTYHLANVVDDHMMNISHVIRGEEWLPSTPKHVLLYQFFGWTPPQFAHLPLLLNPDRSKMSKRSGDVAVEDYRQKGILPQALINFVALLGWHPVDDREILTLDDLIREFSLERVQKAGAVFDMAKLRWMNAEYIKAMSGSALLENLRPHLQDWIAEFGDQRVEYSIEMLRAGAESFEQIAERVREVFGPRPAADPGTMMILDDESARAVVADFAHKMAELPLSDWEDFPKLEEHFKQNAMEAGLVHGRKGKTLWQPLRAALMRQPHGPELAKVMGIWGRERVLTELRQSLKMSKQSVSEE